MIGQYGERVGTGQGHCRESASQCEDSAGIVQGQSMDSVRTVQGDCGNSAGIVQGQLEESVGTVE